MGEDNSATAASNSGRR